MKNDRARKRQAPLAAALTALTLTLALLLAGGCSPLTGVDDGENPNDGLPLGNGYLRVSVSSGGGGSVPSRSMSLDLARNAVNFYEVIFVNYTGGTLDPTYTRHQWYSTNGSPRVNVPYAIYDGQVADGHGKAILLAGTSNAGTQGTEYTLLAAGPLTNVGTGTNPITYDTSDTAARTTITSQTTAVKFTLYAFEAAPSLDASETAFKITNADPIALKTPDTGTIPHVVILGLPGKVPFFSLPKGVSAAGDLQAEYTIKALGAAGSGTAAIPTSSIGGPDHALGELLVFNNGGTGATPPGSLATAGFFTNDDIGLDLVTTGNGLMKITNAHNDKLGTPASGPGVGDQAAVPIKMDLATPNVDGLSVLYIDAWVSGLAVDVNGPTGPGIIWHLRGGMLNYLLDRVTNGGTSTNTTGGGILLVNGQLNSGGILVTVGPPVVTAIAMNPVPDTTPLTMNLTAATAATLNIPFIATVSGTGFYNSAYTWSHVVNTMNGTPDATTFDNSTGVLTVGSGEKAGAASGETKSFTITITATSVGLNGGGVRETISKTFTFNITLP